MKRPMTYALIFAFSLLPATASADRIIKGSIRMTIDDPANPGQLKKRSIELSVQKNTDRVFCGDAIIQFMTERLKTFTVAERDRVFGRLSEIVIKEVRGGITGKPEPQHSYSAKRKKLVIEFKRDRSRSGVNYCSLVRFKNDVCHSGPVCEVWNRFDQWSGRQDAFNIIDLSPGSRTGQDSSEDEDEMFRRRWQQLFQGAASAPEKVKASTTKSDKPSQPEGVVNLGGSAPAPAGAASAQ